MPYMAFIRPSGYRLWVGFQCAKQNQHSTSVNTFCLLEARVLPGNTRNELLTNPVVSGGAETELSDKSWNEHAAEVTEPADRSVMPTSPRLVQPAA